MRNSEFRASLRNATAPSGLTTHVLSLWYAAKGDWDGAHDALQGDDSAECALIHAHLHREEGDMSNARYWYSHAGRSFPRALSIEEEREELIDEFLEKG